MSSVSISLRVRFAYRYCLRVARANLSVMKDIALAMRDSNDAGVRNVFSATIFSGKKLTEKMGIEDEL